MIKKFIEKVEKVFSRRRPREPLDNAKKFIKSQHNINRADISEAALKTCEGLQRAGFKAFVVGGAVRDLLLQRHPKDFDIATDATPEEVRVVFRRSRIIGRRFRLVHVMFGQETIEVSTFRSAHDAKDSEDNANTDEHGRLLRDNVYGTQAEDAIRRDFTMNALFYDPETEEVWDYTGGVGDVAKKRVVMIGEAEARYREDPVRMLRAARLAGKLGFVIDDETKAPIGQLKSLLSNVPEARLFDEILKLMKSGHALDCFAQLQALGLDTLLLPSLDKLLADPASSPFVRLALERTDARIRDDRGVSESFLFAALFWFPMQARCRELEAGGERALTALHQAMDDVLDSQRSVLAIPRRYDGNIKELWLAQPRFLFQSKAKAYRLLTHPRFRACYDFFALRAEAGDADHDIAGWWEKFQFADETTREAMLLPDDAAKKKRRRRKKSANGLAGAGVDAPSSDVSNDNFA